MTSSVPKVRLAGGLEICRVLNGMWQVSGAHGTVNKTKAGSAPPALQGLTKYVPRPGPMELKVVEKALQRSMSRMRVDTLDCVQFHWWDYKDKRYLDALGHLSDLQQEGVIRELALTNFDTQRLEEITNKGICISSNQVHHMPAGSVLSDRPATCSEDGAVLCGQQYKAPHIRIAGCLHCLLPAFLTPSSPSSAGGLLSEQYLGKPEPSSRAELNTASLSKYKNMIDAWGGWTLFQDLLVALETIAKRHECSVASVATRYVLDRPAVGGVIIGCRFGVAGAGLHISDSLRSCSPDLRLTAEDHAAIEAVTRRSRDLMGLIGDCGDEYRS
ncbi:hypothetical protein GOODEAATRI_026166 [Goodea atripinnis]|uniref:NADP-dependent oxidoreductase domain-containing protein n=1 Tax=Goodea atripinnis TaxID=208336 RepID=A0ABV0MW03_9TELE